jgi:CRISPR/Cas system-associated exonuclease Cas4 (RecB family)
MSDEIIQLPIDNEAMDEIFQTLSQTGEIVENEQTGNKKTHFIICPNCGHRISDMNNT